MSEETKPDEVTQAETAQETPVESESAAPAAEAAAQSPHKGFLGKVDNFFGITKSGSSYKTEIVAGLTTFMAMVYILMVNANCFSGAVSYNAAYIATAIGAIVGTMLMAFLAKMPLAQAPGLGINYTVAALVADYAGLSFANALIFVLLDGLLFVVLTATGLRKMIFEAIPNAVRKAIGVGIGLFIAFIGFTNAGLSVSASPVAFASFDVLTTSFGAMIPAIVALFGVIAIAIMSKKKIKGAILWGILGSAVVYYILSAIGYAAGDATCTSTFKAIGEEFNFNPFAAFGDWGTEVAGTVIYKGFDFSEFLANNSGASLALLIITTSLSFCMIDMFDTIGTLYGACRQGNLLDENGTPIRMEKMMLADAIGTCVGAIAGTSTVTTFVESSSGVAAGGKTGFTAFIVSIGFILAMFLAPIAQLIPSCATATALIYVGVLMIGAVVEIDWKDPAEAIVAFLTIAVMVFGYSISKGIGIGIITSIIVSIFMGKIKEIKVATWVIAALYIAMFLLS